MWLLRLLNPLGGIAQRLVDAYAAKQNALTDRDRIEADVTIAQLQARQAVLIAEQAHWMTRWIRPAIAFPVAVYVWKIVLWDTVLGWGVTPNPGEFVNWIVVTVIGAYFLTRPFEKAGGRP